MYISETRRKLMRLNLQFFGDSGEGGDNGGTNGASGENGATNTDTAQNNANTAQGEQAQESALSTEALERLIQSRVDKSTAELGKKISALQKENNNLKKANMTDEEARKIEIADKEKALTEKEQALLERENRLFAIKAIKEIGLDDGSQQSLALVDFVMGENEDAITEKVKAFKALVDSFVSAKVEQTFKANGRVPNNAGTSGEGTTSNIAAELGKKAAETAKQSNEILNHYYRRNK